MFGGVYFGQLSFGQLGSTTGTAYTANFLETVVVTDLKTAAITRSFVDLVTTSEVFIRITKFITLLDSVTVTDLLSYLVNGLIYRWRKEAASDSVFAKVPLASSTWTKQPKTNSTIWTKQGGPG